MDEEAFAKEMMGGMTDPEYSRHFLHKLTPEVRARVSVLQAMDKRISDNAKEHDAALLKVKRKYHQLAQTIFQKRAMVLSGKTEVTEKLVSSGYPSEHEGKVEIDGPVNTDGLKGFWLRVMQHHKLVQAMISPRDEEGLKFLEDITCEILPDPETGFALKFHFAENPFFTESVLTKTFILKSVDGWNEAAEKSVGCPITWSEGNNLTVEYKKKKQRGKKGSRVVTKETPCSSFFDFFCSWGDKGYTEEDLQVDYAVGDLIRSKMIPYAVSFYTGEADNGSRQMEEGPAGMMLGPDGMMGGPEAMMGGMEQACAQQ